MATDNEIKITLEAAKSVRDTIKQEGGFSGKKGEASLDKVNNIIKTIEKLDPSKTDLLNKELKNLSALLLNASKYTKGVNSELAQAVTKLQELKTQQKDLQKELREAYKARKQSIEQLKEDKEISKYTFRSKKTGEDVSSYKTISALHREGNLQILNQAGTLLKGAAAETVYQGRFGQADLASQQVEALKAKLQQSKTEAEQVQIQVDQLELQAKDGKAIAETLKFTGQVEKLTEQPEQDIGGLDVDDINLNTKALDRQNTSLGKAFKQFSIYAIALRTVKAALREATQTIARLDQYLTEQAMVTGKTRKETYQLLESYQSMASELGTTTKEVAEVTTQFLRQGKSVQDSLKLTEAAISAAKVAGISATESVNYLTTALNGFQLSADQAIRVSDKFAAVAATAATSYDEIAIALSKVAAQANLAGMSIDYTTALLTKGLETTREAPETIGTALKTIIARMRELSDYGETLGGDTDINNVESQLAYVGIQLRDNNGELRSTEDVLNDLGQKWDTLNSNQQAAVAKALAGTRQQSRLIAMMSDYERVLELQQISERSAGATVAQMATYLEGMEAATNRVRVAWETIITTVANNELIIGLVNVGANLLESLNGILGTLPGMIMAVTTLSILSLNIVGNKLREYELSKLQQKLDLQRAQAENKANQDQIRANIIQLAQEKKLSNAQEIKTKLAEAEAAAKQGNLAEAKKLTAEAKLLNTEGDTEINQQFELLEGFQLQADTLALQASNLLGLAGAWSGILAIVNAINTALGIGNLLEMTRVALKGKENQEDKKAIANAMLQNKTELKGLPGLIAKAYAKCVANLGPIAGTVAFGAIAAAITALGVMGGIAIAGGFRQADPLESIDATSNSIYQLSKSTTAIQSTISAFEKLDEHIIKTKKDTEDMATALEGAADKLSSDTEGALHGMLGLRTGQSAQDYYKTLTSDKQRLEFLKRYTELSNQLIRQQHEQIINTIKQNKLDLSKVENANAAAAVYARNNLILYDYIDSLGIEAEGLQEVTQAILEQIDANQALNLTQQQIQELTQKIQSSGATSIFAEEGGSILDRARAFRDLSSALQNDADAIKALNLAYSEWVTLAGMNDDTLFMLDTLGLTADKLNDLNAAYTKLQKNGILISQESYQSRIPTLLDTLAITGGDVAATIRTVFASELARAGDDYEKWWNAFVSVLGDTLTVGILNMGQSMDTLQNNINAFYEKASKWSTLTETQKNEFLADYADLFSGPDGARLKEAFASGNYNLIHEALFNNQALQDQVDRQLQQVEQELEIEKARIGSARNEAYIAELEAYKKQLQNRNKLFQADLKLRLDQQNEQLNEYKSYLQEQEKALTDSLNKRREAYEKYFDAINESKEDEEYEEQAQLLASNLSKLGSSTNAAAVNQRAELTQQLTELEKERLETLRERAQEAILNEMDDTLNAISEKFDKLLENNQALLMALTGQLNDPTRFLTSMLSNRIAGGATELEMQDYLNTLRSTYGSILSDIDWDSFAFGTDVSNNLTLNVAGQEVNLSTADSRIVFTAIETALKQIGYR